MNAAGSGDTKAVAAGGAETHGQHGHEQVEPGSTALHPEALVSLYGQFLACMCKSYSSQ